MIGALAEERSPWALLIEGGAFCMIGPERCERCPAKATVEEGEASPCDHCQLDGT